MVVEGVTSRLRRGVQRASIVTAAIAAIAVGLTTSRLLGDDPTRPAGSAAPVEQTAPAPAQPQAPAPAELLPAPTVQPAVATAARRGPLAAAYPGTIDSAPGEAVAAYQRASAVINAASSCQLDWLVLAAIGRVESNHGQGEDGTHRVGAKGKVKPAYTGKPLNGRGGRDSVADTEGGVLDGNKRWDAPVGPMGLLPSTWTSVAVDADGDSVRDPQDLDDAALAAAVVLCAGGRDLADTAVLKEALRGYDGARRFAPTVTALAAAYGAENAALPTALPMRVPAPAVVPLRVDMPEACGCSDVRFVRSWTAVFQPSEALTTPDAPQEEEPAPTAPDPNAPDPNAPDPNAPDPNAPTDPAPPVVTAAAPGQPTEQPTDQPTEQPADGPTPSEKPDEPRCEPAREESEPADAVTPDAAAELDDATDPACEEPDGGSGEPGEPGEPGSVSATDAGAPARTPEQTD